MLFLLTNLFVYASLFLFPALPIGFWGALVSSSRGTLGRAEQDAPIYFDDIFCEGDELFLSQCHHHLLTDDFGFPWFCGSHYYDAGVICQGKRCHTCTQSITYVYVMLIIIVLFMDNIDFTS